MKTEEIKLLNDQFKNRSEKEILEYFLFKYGETAVFSSSFQAEDQAITDMICKVNQTIGFFTIDTGRLHQETYNTLEKTELKYGIKFKIFFPDYRDIEKTVYDKGINMFYQSVDNRKECCRIRKVLPLKRALNSAKVWITGLRREQSITRKNIDLISYDSEYQIIKVNPILEWSYQKMWDYLRTHEVPLNKLHELGFPSIGCEPCTRPVQPGDNTRAGRWWWENPEHKECGLHKSCSYSI
ncbi:MAG: phosphoadenosine phosphosulfate reductase [Spirochaetes bacterium GWF1_41_5]|nr:MAG: phosphoadenosine phosphosulfate reductase [Spirochaetes bacterium GWF1_41_5]